MIWDGFTSWLLIKFRDIFKGKGGGGGGGLMMIWLWADDGEHVDEETICVVLAEVTAGVPGNRKSPLEIGCWITG